MIERVAATRPQFVDAVGAITGELRDPAADLFDAIASSNWALEWGMADWLAEAYGLDERTVESLHLSNICMIAFARLIDDLADGESRFAPGVATPLAVTLQHVWSSSYARMFHGSVHESLFWSTFDRHLGRWMRATLTGGEATALADRAAFLDVALAAGCLVAGRPDVLHELELAMGDLAVGIVMLDDVFDWRVDLAGARNNAFVDHVWSDPIGAAPREAVGRAVTRELYVGAGSSYFDALLARLDGAHRHARAAGCEGLARFVEWYAAEAGACARHFAARAMAGRSLFTALAGTTSISAHTGAPQATAAYNPQGDSHGKGAKRRR
jgi:hypothetical protein